MKYIIILISWIFCCTTQNATENAIPDCIAHKISNPSDSLRKIGSIAEVKIQGRTLYKFSQNKDSLKLHPVSVTVWTDSICNKVAEVMIGGAAGVQISGPFTLQQLNDIESNKIIWTASVDTNKVQATKIVNKVSGDIGKAYFTPFTQVQKFKINEVNEAYNFLKVRKGDIIEVSMQHGLYVKAGNKVKERYKIMPEESVFQHPLNCTRAPCPTRKVTMPYFLWDQTGIRIYKNHRSKWVLDMLDFSTERKERYSHDWDNAYMLEIIN